MKKTDYQNEVISRIRLLRIDRNISQVALASILEVSNGQIGNIESPKFQHKYTLKQLYQIAKQFNVSLSYLLTGTTEELDMDSLIKALIDYE